MLPSFSVSSHTAVAVAAYSVETRATSGLPMICGVTLGRCAQGAPTLPLGPTEDYQQHLVIFLGQKEGPGKQKISQRAS